MRVPFGQPTRSSYRNPGPSAVRAGTKSPAMPTSWSARSGRRARRRATALAERRPGDDALQQPVQAELVAGGGVAGAVVGAQVVEPVRAQGASATSAASSALRRARVTPSPVKGS